MVSEQCRNVYPIHYTETEGKTKLITLSFSLYKPAPQTGTHCVFTGLQYKYLLILEYVAKRRYSFKDA